MAETAPSSATPSTTALRPISFEAGLLIDSSTGGDSQAGMSLDTSAAINGQYAAKTTSTGSGQYLQQDLTAASQLYGRVYVRLDVTPTADAPLVQLRSGTTVIGTLIVTTNRTVELRNGSTLIGTSAALTVGTVYRLGIRQTQGSGTGVLSAWLATGDTAFGTAFASSTTQTIASATDSVRLGSPGTGAVLRVTVDDLALDTASMPPASGVAATRTIGYGYDGVDRLTSATATGSPALSQSFSYDAAGNRIVSGVTYNAANQRSDLTYDLTGNVTADGASTSTYDALNRLTSRTASSVTTSYGVNGDGALVSEQVGSGTVTRFTQDLAAPLSQILSDGTTSYVYGADRLFRLTGSTRTWELHDGLGSVMRTSSDTGVGATPVFYEPFGAIQSGTPGLFGFTGERQSGANVYLRARWYNTATGTFTARDPFAGFATTPYSLHSYQYGYANPVSNTDPTGQCIFEPVEFVLCAALLSAAIVAIGGTIAVTTSGTAFTQLHGRQPVLSFSLPEVQNPFTILSKRFDNLCFISKMISVVGSVAARELRLITVPEVPNNPITPPVEQMQTLQYTVNSHAYGRAGHAKDEAEVHELINQIFEWWYDPTSVRRTGQALYAGLAGYGPTATIYYNATRTTINDVIFMPTIGDARVYIYRRGYTQRVI